MAQPVTPLAADPFDWQPIAPSDAGFAPDLEARLDKLIADKRAWNLHGVVVVRNDRLVLERYFQGEDNARGRPLGKVAFTPDTQHDLRSVSKGVVGLLYGIALEQGKVPGLNRPLFEAFPEYADLAGGAGRDRLTIHHVLTMTMGTDWDETSIPYSDPGEQRNRHGFGARSVSLHPRAPRYHGAGQALELLRRGNGAAGPHDCQGHGQTAA